MIFLFRNYICLRTNGADMKKFLVFLVFICGIAFAEESSVSVVVKDSKGIKKIVDEIVQMQRSFGNDYSELDKLFKESSRIAKMNDRCGTISLTELIDSSCVHFYEVDLPAFENKYMEITGEVRLNSVRMGNQLEDRKSQLSACSEALFAILVPYEQLFKLHGKIKLEPVDDHGTVETEYDYVMSYDTKRMNVQKALGTKWVGKCGGLIMRENGVEFAPYFLNKIREYNQSLDLQDVNMVLDVDTSAIRIGVNMRYPEHGSYFMNGAVLFDTIVGPLSKPYLLLDMRAGVARLPLGTVGEIGTFKGRKEISTAYNGDLAGRWMWGKLNESGTVMTLEKPYFGSGDSENENTPVGVDYTGEDRNTQGNFDSSIPTNIEQEKKGNISTVLMISSAAVFAGGTILAIVGNSSAKSESEKKSNSQVEYEKHYDKIGSYQTMRSVGIGIAVLGAVGFGLSFAF